MIRCPEINCIFNYLVLPRHAIEREKKAANIGNYRRQTGGGPPCQTVLSEFDETVIAHLPQGSITGHSKVPERGLKFVSLPI